MRQMIVLTEDEERLIEARVLANEREPHAVCSRESVMEEVDRALAAKRRS